MNKYEKHNMTLNEFIKYETTQFECEIFKIRNKTLNKN